MTTVPLAQARAQLSILVDQVLAGDQIQITRNGQPVAVLISVDDLESWQDTLDVLATPGLADELAAADGTNAVRMTREEIWAERRAAQAARV